MSDGVASDGLYGGGGAASTVEVDSIAAVLSSPSAISAAISTPTAIVASIEGGTDVDIETPKGETYTANITVTEGGSPRDITNDTLIATLRRKSDDGGYELRAVTAGDITHTDPVNGVAQLVWTKTQTDRQATTYRFDIFLEQTAGNPRNQVFGPVNFKLTEDVGKVTDT